MTHLHKDHTDGLRYFNKSEIIVSRSEFVNPYGAMEATFPKWFIPNLIAYITKLTQFLRTHMCLPNEKTF